MERPKERVHRDLPFSSGLLTTDEASYLFYFLRNAQGKTGLDEKLEQLRTKIETRRAATLEGWLGKVLNGEKLGLGQLGDKLLLTDSLLVPPDSAVRPVFPGEQDENPDCATQPRNWLLIDLLAQIGISNYKVVMSTLGAREARTFRQEPYYAYLLPDQKVIVLVCDAYGNQTFVITQLEDCLSEWPQFINKTKEEIKTLGEDKVSVIRWVGSGQRWQDLVRDPIIGKIGAAARFLSTNAMEERYGISGQTLDRHRELLLAEHPELADEIRTHPGADGTLYEYGPRAREIIVKKFKDENHIDPDWLNLLALADIGANRLSVGKNFSEADRVALANSIHRSLVKRFETFKKNEKKLRPDRVEGETQEDPAAPVEEAEPTSSKRWKRVGVVIYLSPQAQEDLLGPVIEQKRKKIEVPLAPPELTKTLAATAAKIRVDCELQTMPSGKILDAVERYARTEQASHAHFDMVTRQGDYGKFVPAIGGTPSLYISSIFHDKIVTEFKRRVTKNRETGVASENDTTLNEIIEIFLDAHSIPRSKRSILYRFLERTFARTGKFVVGSPGVRRVCRLLTDTQELVFYDSESQKAIQALLEENVSLWTDRKEENK